ncbi:MAG: hypothetical protein KF797_01020 [Flavobacteriales bacterium]|nr:hypothetical protein [Flavobacteriales bacterium]
MSEKDLLNIRTALIVTLSALLLLILWRRLRQYILTKDMPAPLHAELLGLELAYHPARLRVVVKVPGEQVIHTRLLDQAHAPFHTWDEERLQRGEHILERALPPLADGTYFLEMATTTQRTVRQFRLQQA